MVFCPGSPHPQHRRGKREAAMVPDIIVIGGGLAGSDAAGQAARQGARVALYEMRPVRQTPAHKTGSLAELVCSNSLKSEQENTAPWLLKEELRRLGSLLIGDIAPTD